jgi:hypothetical protein
MSKHYNKKCPYMPSDFTRFWRNSFMGESIIKYTFFDPCQEKCKVNINQALTYQILKYYLI